MDSDEAVRLDHLQWIDDLRSTVESISNENPDTNAAIITYFNAVRKLNAGLSWIVPVAEFPCGDDLNHVFEDIVGRMRSVLYEILHLRKVLPSGILQRNTVISHAQFHTRSWAEIVLEAVELIVILTHANATKRMSEKQAAGFLALGSYDTKFVGVQLEIEYEQIQIQLEQVGVESRTMECPRCSASSHSTEHHISHAEDFTSVNWYGIEYTFTPTQRAVIAALWKAMESGSRSVSDAALIEAAGSAATHLRDIFRPSGVRHPAWNTMIVNVGRDARKLSLKNPESHTDATVSHT